jgi:hypothetical protein
MSITPNPPGQTPGKPLDQSQPGDSRAPGANPSHPDRAPQTSPADRKPGDEATERSIPDVDRKVRGGDA